MSENATVIKLNKFDSKKISFGPKKGRNVKLFYDKSDFLLRFPRMSAPFEPSKMSFNKHFSIYSLTLSMYDGHVDVNTDEIELLKKQLVLMEEAIIHKAVSYSNVWFDEELTETEVRSRFKSFMYSNNPNYAASLRFKVATDEDGDLKFDLFDEKGNELDITTFEELKENVPAKSQLKVIAECTGLWIKTDKSGDTTFGPTWQLVHGLVYDQANFKGNDNINLDKFAFGDE